MRRHDLYAIATYPDAGFRNDAQTQEGVTTRSRQNGRRLVGLFLSWTAVFFVTLLLAILGLPSVIFVGFPVLFVLLVPSLFMTLYLPVIVCSQCGHKMKNDWRTLRNGR